MLLALECVWRSRLEGERDAPGVGVCLEGAGWKESVMLPVLECVWRSRLEGERDAPGVGVCLEEQVGRRA